jgi:hypothetical protein
LKSRKDFFAAGQKFIVHDNSSGFLNTGSGESGFFGPS